MIHSATCFLNAETRKCTDNIENIELQLWVFKWMKKSGWAYYKKELCSCKIETKLAIHDAHLIFETHLLS